MSRVVLFDRKSAEDRDYWLSRLPREPRPRGVWSGHPRSRPEGTETAEIGLEIGEALDEKLAQLTGESPFLIYTSLLSVLRICLARYSGDATVTVGSPSRQVEGAQPGNVLAIIDVVDERLTFRELLLQVRSTLLEAYSHQSYPFERLLRDLGLQQDGSGCPLFDVALALEGLHADLPDVGNAVTILARKQEGRLTGRVRVRQALVDPDAIQRLIHHFVQLLREALNDSSRPVCDLEMLSEGERRQLLVGWNQTRVEFPCEAAVHELFAGQAARTPGAVAAVCGTERLSYAELERRSERLARRLRALGIGLEERVGLCAERSLELAVALLGILRAGGAYLPLDPSSPRERQAWLLGDAGVQVLIADRRLLASLPEREGLRVLWLDELEAGEEPVAELPEVPSGALAYVMYTSGSTGTPKGVAVTHRSVVRLVRGTDYAAMGPQEVWLQYAPVSFDASTLEIWAPLLNGGRLAFFPGRRASLDELAAAIREQEVTSLWLTAGLFHQMVDYRLEALRPLSQLLAGGDVIAPGHARRVLAGLPGLALVNGYGPTEATTFTCCHRMTDLRQVGATVAIGRPIANARVYLLDERLRPVPVGVAGELYASGEGLARGYLGRPDLTAERFLPDPFGEEPGGRLYRTGDLARYRSVSEGDIEFLGRIDGQVKIRGFRIELGEVESTLSSHPGVQEAVVLSRGDGPGEKRLAAYVVARGDRDLSPQELSGFLRERLPEHMVPSDFVMMQAMPLTPNGKVDRRALPAPSGHEAFAEDSFVALQGMTEELLAGIWCEVLDLERVGSDQDFFALGGHSLLATQVMSRVRDVFRIELPLSALFDQPTVAGLAGQVATAKQESEGLEAPILAPVARTSDLPLSFAQQRLWFLDQMDPGRSTYNLSIAWRLAGRLHLPVLARALTEVVRRHEGLRTVFPSHNGEPVQQIAPQLPTLFCVTDLSALPQEVASTEARRLVAQVELLPFDLSRGPLLRALLVRLGEEEHRLLLAMHHIVSDGWSLEILKRELSMLYAAFESGEPSPLPELPIQYADYACWQRQWLQGEPLEQRLAYWKRQLAGAPPEIGLPTDRPRPAVQEHDGASVTAKLAPEVSTALRRLVQRQGATLFMGLLAAFKVLLMRSTGQHDLAVGTPMAGRNRREIEDLIGFFVNTLVLRSDLGGDPDFLALLERVRETSLEAHRHQDLPFEKLVEELRPERSLSHSPLFQVMFDVLSRPAEPGGPAGLRAQPVEVGSPTAKFDLTLSLVEYPQGLLMAAEYNTALFDRTTVRRMLEHYATLLTDIAEAPSRRLSELSLLSSAERAQLSREWNDTGAPELRASRVQDLFEIQVERSPEAVAVEHGGSSLSYAGLNAQANRLAHHLRALGVRPEAAVGLLMERSIEMVIGLLAVLKAGGFYVPFDPASPRERLARSLEDCGATVVLTQRSLAQALPAGQLLPVVVDGGEWHSQSGKNPAAEASAANAAYVIYTSGSTGAPRGVVVQHGSLASYTLVAAAQYGFAPAERVLQFAAVSFDTSAEEIYPSLASGATLALRSDEMLSSAAVFLREVERLAITVLDLPSAFWHELVAALESEGLALPPCLRLVIIGGEAALPERLASWHEQVQGRVRLMNGYGPTEVTIVATLGELPPEQDCSLTAVPIGRAIRNAQTYLLDADRLAVPIGVAGELCVGGRGLARGYLGRPELTAERFIPDPFGSEAGERLYRTGDLVRHLPDGRIEFLGRTDHQVKVRGFRIELGEIEAALAEIPGVRNGVVVARERRPGDLGLVAYVVAEGEGAPATADLRSALAAKLPDYMIPSAFVFLPALPLTSTGKLDRRALPAPEPVTGSAGALAPRTAVEEILLGIWSELLGLERIGVEDDFFALGGHSLLATRVISRVRRVFGVEVQVRALFEAPTMAGFAKKIVQTREYGRPMAPPIERVPREGLLPLSFGQQRLWFLHQWEPGSPAYNIPMALRLEGRLCPAVLARALGEIVRRHESLRTVFSLEEDEPVQRIQPAGAWNLLLVDLRGLDEPWKEREAHRLVREEAELAFDLELGPVFRASLLHLQEIDQVLLMTVHHIASDGWSNGILARELQTLYQAFAAGSPSPLPELPIQYADYACWQRQWLSGEVLETELAYWRRQLSGAAPVLELPTDRPRQPMQGSRGSSELFHLPAGPAGSLARLGRREGATLFMTLLAAFQALLARFSGSEDISIGTPVAGRTRFETEALIGFFVNTLVLRLDLGGNPEFRSLLGRACEVALEAHAHQDLPFEKLVEELEPERNLSHSPLFQVMLVLQNAQEARAELPGVRLRGMEGRGTTAKFDLMLALSEGPGGLFGALEYKTELFDRPTVRRLLDHFTTLLEGVTVEPDQRLSQLPLLSEIERQQLLREWSDGGVVSGPASLVHEQIERQAILRPEAAALSCGGRTLSYGELESRSGQLARRLRALGVGPEARVGVCLERTPELVIALLGVLRAGGAYVPMDPAYPAERLAFMAADAQVRLLIWSETVESRLPGLTGLEVRKLLLAPDSGAIGPPGTEAPAGAALPGNLAYVIYTSGSTGRPKGVAITHASVSALVRWAAGAFSDRELSGVLAATSVCFDLSVFELFAPLCLGGRVILAQDALHLPSLPEAEEVRLVNTVPSAMAELVRTGGVPESVRTVCLAGEPLPAHLAEDLYRLGVGRVLNLYGPSEDTTYSTWDRVVVAAGRAPAIGRPVSGTRAYLLDRTGEPVPAGVAGELYLAGEGLARGYLGRPELTAERFVPDPYGAGERLYRTGDLARDLADGRLEFLGRIDHQVKVRGFRIEPGEIEATLRERSGVREAVVVAAGEKLVAYVVPEAAGEPPVAELRSWLRERLPQYMVPTAFVVLPALPLTPNGKVDRRALPAPQEPVTESAGDLPPRTAVEEILLGIWSELLGLQSIGVEADFFALGGHSLLATRVISRVLKVFGVEVQVRALFEAPTIIAFARRVEEARQQSAEAVPPIEPVARTSGLPLSFAQQRLWFLDQMDPRSSTYNLSVAWQLAGRLNLPALARSIVEVVRRHEVLRTAFPSLHGEPSQEIAPAASVPFQAADLGALPQAAARAEARRLVAQVELLPFDLSRGPLFRALLVCLDEEEHRLLLVMHHIVSDGWSLEILRRELRTLYAAFESGKPSPLPELPIQYADYARWQRQWLQGEALEQRLAYWKRQLAGAPPEIDLPTDRPRPAVQDHGGASVARRLAPEVSAAMHRLVQQQGATLFMGLLAALKVLLMRYTGQHDLVVGTPIAGRNRWEIEDLVGFFVNTLVLRSDLSGDPDFFTLLERVRETALEAHRHQDLPFEKLVEELRPERSLSHSPLFQVMFDVARLPAEAGGPASLSARPIETGSPATAKFDLTVSIVDHPQGLLVAAELSTALFDRTAVLRMLEHYATLLEDLSAGPSRLLSELSLLSPAERAQLSVEWNDTGAPEPRASRVQDLFEAQVERTPEAVAVICVGDCLSYRELDERSTALAIRIHRALTDSQLDRRIGLLADPDPQVLIGMIGILKAGGGFVPIDPRHPDERLAWILGDCSCEVLVTQRRHLERAAGLAAGTAGVRHILCLEDAHPTRLSSGTVPAGAPGDRRDPRELRSLAYVVYTSGSTGRPKGVQVSHESLVPMLLWGCEHLGLGEHTRVLQSLSFCFDFGIFEHLTTVLAGGTLWFPGEAAEDPAAFAREIVRHGIDTLHTTPAFARELAAAETVLDSLDIVHLGGEALARDTVTRLREAAPRAAVYNGYGPTEATINSSIFQIGARSGGPQEPGWPVIPIGRRSADNRLYILDRGRLVPFGARGELHVGGIGVARGYLKRPDLTAERFVPDPFAAAPGGRLYRTGDLVRYLPEGDIAFLGRIDQQVKVRGFRMELGEIEAALREHPAVREAAVITRPEPSGDLRLVAYVVAEAVAPELRAFLAQRLPPPMVPSAFVALAALPLTPTGKLDRQALPAIEAVRADPASSFVAPRDTLELRLAQIWEDLLGVHPVGVRDDFFALGGHSLLTVRLASRVQRLTGRSLSLATFFQEPTVERLSQVLRRQGSPSASSLVPIRPAGSRRPLCFVHPVGGHVLGYLPLARHLGPDRPFHAFQAEGLDGGPVRTGIEEMAERYVEELLAFQPAGPHLLGGWSLGGLVALEMVRHLEARGQRVAGLLLLDSVLPNGGTPVPDDLLMTLFARDLGLDRGQPGEGLAALLERARRTSIVSPDLELPVLERFFTVFKANFRAMDAYRAGPYPGPARLLISQRTARSDHPAAAWRAVAPSLSIHEVPGDHYTMMREPHVQVLAREVDAFCSSVEAGLL